MAKTQPDQPLRNPNKVNFAEIPQFTRGANYTVDIIWSSLLNTIEWHTKDYGLNLEPDFQRAHVWNETQQRKYVEYILRGGMSGRDLYFNCINWNKNLNLGEYVIVDGKQRLNAVVKFLKNELTIFDGHKFSDYSDSLRMTAARFRWHINDLDTRAEVLTWYLEHNSGGTIHTDEELEKVRKLLLAEGR